MLLPAHNPTSVDGKDDWLVIRQEGTDWRVIESQPTKEQADKACRILQEHDHSNGRCTKYDTRTMGAYTQLGMKNRRR